MQIINLTVRFILEVVLLLIVGKWGLEQSPGWPGYLLAIGIPLLLATLWVVFAVPGDPSRSGKTVVVTPGWIRLLMELSFFAFGAWCFFDLGYKQAGMVFSVTTVIHYLASYPRVIWLLKQ